MTDRPRRELPPHIAAQLASAGRETDTAGQPWAGRDLTDEGAHGHLFPEDDGTAVEQVAAARERLLRGEATEAEVVAALDGTRMFVAVVAEVSSSTVTDEGLVADKEADMALVTLSAADGRTTLPLFTSTEELQRWHPTARPVAAQIRKIALAAVKDGTDLMVLDPGGDIPFVVRRPALWALAKGERWTPSYDHPDVLQAVREAAAGVPTARGVRVEPGAGVVATSREGRPVPGGGSGPELRVVLQLVPGLDQVGVDAAVSAFQQGLAVQPVMAEQVDSMQIGLAVAGL